VFKSSDTFARKNSPKRKVVFATLDTPVDLCIQRVRQRRAAVGNSKPFDPSKLETKFRSVQSSQQRLTASGWDCRTIPHGNALNTLLDWMGILNVTPEEMEKFKTEIQAARFTTAQNLNRGIGAFNSATNLAG
jgi:hypothetical protein